MKRISEMNSERDVRDLRALRIRVGAGLLAAALGAALFLTACGASKSSDNFMERGGYSGAAAETMAETTAAAYAPIALADSGMGMNYDYRTEELAEEDVAGDAAEIPDPNVGKKLIYRYDLSAETRDYPEEIRRIEESVTRYGGYIESSHRSEPSGNPRYSSRSANYQIRIPVQNAEKFLNEASETLNVTERSSNVEDITSAYSDTEARKLALETEEKRLLEILEKAETVEDLMAVESRLSDVRYERESLVRQLRSYDNKVAYSSISLFIREVREYTEEEPETVQMRITKGFAKSVKDVKEGLTDFFVWLVTHSPQIAIFLVVVFLLSLLGKVLGKRRAAKRAEKAARLAAASPGERAAKEEQDKKLHRFLFGSGRKSLKQEQKEQPADGKNEDIKETRLLN